MVCPVWLLASQVSCFNQTYGAAVQAWSYIPQRIAAKGLVPDLITVFTHGHGAGKNQGPFLGADGHEDLPFFSFGKGF